MLRGTRVVKFEDAELFVNTVDRLRKLSKERGIRELIFPSILESSTFTKKLSIKKKGQMWTFQDKARGNCCLVPEITGIAQELWCTEWCNQFKVLCRSFMSNGATDMNGLKPVDIVSSISSA